MEVDIAEINLSSAMYMGKSLGVSETTTALLNLEQGDTECSEDSPESGCVVKINS